MSMIRLFIACNSLLLATVFATASMAQYQSHTHFDGPTLGGKNNGQDGLRLGPSARPFGNPDPILDENWYDYDAQMWAPFDVTGVDGHVHAPTGLFFAYDFAHISLTRPDNQFGLTNGVQGGNDYHWGKKYHLGHMGEGGAGFSANWLTLEGSFFPRGQPEEIDTVKYNIVELNRTFRQAVTTGGYIEPYIGLRYMALSDRTFHDVGVNRFRQVVTNSAVGGQIGSRYVRDIGTRLVLSVDGTLGGMYNSQEYAGINETDTGGAVFTVNTQRVTSGNDFIPFLDVDLGLQYRITRDISLRAGGAIIYNWDGLARANNLPLQTNPYSSLSGFAAPLTPHTEDNIAAGFTFGFDWRR